jgi:hypothetical protein
METVRKVVAPLAVAAGGGLAWALHEWAPVLLPLAALPVAVAGIVVIAAAERRGRGGAQ